MSAPPASAARRRGTVDSAVGKPEVMKDTNALPGQLVGAAGAGPRKVTHAWSW